MTDISDDANTGVLISP